MSKMAPFVNEVLHAISLTDMFIPFLKIKPIGEKVKSDIFRVLTGLIPLLTEFSTREEYILKLVPLFRTYNQESLRLQLCELISLLLEKHPLNQLTTDDVDMPLGDISLASLLVTLNSVTSSAHELRN